MNKKPDAEALTLMKERGGDWFAYENHDLGHSQCGHLKFLKCGAGCTFPTPPNRLPDTATAIHWRYVLIGKVNLETGEIV